MSPADESIRRIPAHSSIWAPLKFFLTIATLTSNRVANAPAIFDIALSVGLTLDLGGSNTHVGSFVRHVLEAGPLMKTGLTLIIRKHSTSARWWPQCEIIRDIIHKCNLCQLCGFDQETIE